MQVAVLDTFSEREATSPRGWDVRVTITRNITTPGGTEHEDENGYNYKNGADNESKDQRRMRLQVKAKARRLCLEKFDPAKHEASKAKRRKGRGMPVAEDAAFEPGAAEQLLDAARTEELDV